MEFDFLEVIEQEHLDELKMMGFVCINHLLIDVPEDVIVLGKLTFKANDPAYDEYLKFSGSMDISNMTINNAKRILAIFQKKEPENIKEDIINNIISIV
jgi:hypothetical protein